MGMIFCRGGARRHAGVEIGGERGERHRFEPVEQQRLRLAEAGVERGVDRLLDKAAGRVGAVAHRHQVWAADRVIDVAHRDGGQVACDRPAAAMRSEEHTSELQSLMRISYAVFCLKKKIRMTKDK